MKKINKMIASDMQLDDKLNVFVFYLEMKGVRNGKVEPLRIPFGDYCGIMVNVIDGNLTLDRVWFDGSAIADQIFTAILALLVPYVDMTKGGKDGNEGVVEVTDTGMKYYLKE